MFEKGRLRTYIILFVFLFFFLYVGCGNVTEKESLENTTLENLTSQIFSKYLLIPLYFYNLSLWEKVADLNYKGLIIINPNNGPGKNVDPNYQNLIDKLLNKSKIPIGYVYTKWGTRNITLVESDIDTWLNLYPKIKGFFLDESATSLDKLSYYETLKNYIKNKGKYIIILNPGTYPNEAYFRVSDVIVVFENSYQNFNPEVCLKYPNQSAIIVYNASYEDMLSIINSSCKYMYITDNNNLTNPYNTLPSYFEKEIEYFR